MIVFTTFVFDSLKNKFYYKWLNLYSLFVTLKCYYGLGVNYC